MFDAIDEADVECSGDSSLHVVDMLSWMEKKGLTGSQETTFDIGTVADIKVCRSYSDDHRNPVGTITLIDLIRTSTLL